MSELAMPAVSVLTTAYNAAEFIDAAIVSITQQTFADWEMVVVDDGSTDDTPAIVRRYSSADSRVVLLEPSHLGRVGALNFGLERVRGRYTAVLDADDVALPTRLERQLHVLRRSPDLSVIGSGCVEMTRSGADIRTVIYPSRHKPLFRALEKLGAFFPHSSAMFPTDLARRLGGYRDAYVRSMDWDLLMRLGENGQLAALPLPLVRLRRHADSISHTQSGRLQQTMGMAGTVCHFLRAAGHPDPSVNPTAWSSFIAWIEKRLVETEYYDVLGMNGEVRALLDGGPEGWAGLAARLSDRVGRKFVWRQLTGGTRLARQLALEFARA